MVLVLGREGGSWGRRSLSSPGRAAIFARGKETGLRDLISKIRR